MLDWMIKDIKTLDKYTVRVVDEGIHNLVNRAVTALEAKGVERDDQVMYLGSLTAFGSAFFLVADLAEDARSIIRGNFQSFLDSLGTFRYGTNSAVIYLSVEDVNRYLHNQVQGQSDGSIANDVYSYNSTTGVVRPYLLAASIGATIYGFKNQQYDAIRYGIVMLPWILSMYARDDKSGGLLERIGNRIKELFEIRMPVPQSIPIRK